MLDQREHDAVAGPRDRETPVVRHHFRRSPARRGEGSRDAVDVPHRFIGAYLPSATACTPVEIVIIACLSTAESRGPYSPVFSGRILSRSAMARARGAMPVSIGVAITQFLLVIRALSPSGIAANLVFSRS
jgi:hypothetical protein